MADDIGQGIVKVTETAVKIEENSPGDEVRLSYIAVVREYALKW